MAHKHTNVLIIESIPIIRLGIEKLLNNYREISIIGITGTIAEGLEIAKAQSPQVIVADLAHPDGNIVSIIPELNNMGITKVLGYSTHDDWNNIAPFLEVGGAGFVSKYAPLEELPKAIIAVANGGSWISPSLKQQNPNSRFNKILSLSAREMEVAVLIANGMTSKQIADRLYISLKTVESHRYRIFKKLGITRCAQLASYVVEHIHVKKQSLH